MDYAIEILAARQLAKLVAVANVDLTEFEIRIAACGLEVRPLDLRRIEVIQIIDNRNVPIAFG